MSSMDDHPAQELQEQELSDIGKLEQIMDGQLITLITADDSSDEEPILQVDTKTIDDVSIEEPESVISTFQMTEVDDAKDKNETPPEENNEIVVTVGETVNPEPVIESESDSPPEPEEYEEPPSPKRKRKASKQETEPLVTYSDSELEDAYAEWKKKKTLPPFLMKDSIICYGRKITLSLLMEEKYDDANLNEQILTGLVQAFRDDSTGFDNDTAIRGLEGRLNAAKQAKLTENRQYQDQLKYIKETTEKKIASLDEQHEYERSQFAFNVQKPEFLQRFSKPSARLIQLRYIQKTLAISRNFKGAKLAKVEADRLERQETETAKSRAAQNIRLTYQQMLDRQRHQIECARKNGDRKIQELEESMLRESDANNNLKRQLESRIVETRTRKTGPKPVSGQQTIMPQEDRLKLREFRKAPAQSLDLKLPEFKTIVSSIKQSPYLPPLSKKK